MNNTLPPRPLYPHGHSPRYTVDVGLGWPRAGADVSKEEKKYVILSRSTEA
jgi:hypothetical protein